MDLTVVPHQAAAREYKKGNWTLQETMVLIEAKKMDDQRRMSKRQGDSGGERGKPTELRWKWVEDFCWNKGCLRSQNQCNDKWDNLMRDFKKVREYERRLAERGDQQDKSYWILEKNERKDNNLPSNMLPQIFEALVDVVEKKGQWATPGSAGAGSSSGNVPMPVGLLETFPVVEGLAHQQVSPQGQRQHPIVQAQTVLALPPPLQTASAAETPILPSSQPQHTVDSDTREHTDSPSKRRKKRGISSSGGGDREATSGGGGGGGGGGEVIGSAISRSASIIAEAIQSGEERQERRHRELVRLQQRRLQIEESKAEINRQGVNGLVDAINKLANSIVTLAGNTSRQTPPPPAPPPPK